MSLIVALWNMDQKRSVVRLGVFAFLLADRSVPGQSFEASANGGFGIAERDSFGIRSVPLAGVTFGWPFPSVHKLEFDYTFGHIERETESSGGHAQASIVVSSSLQAMCSSDDKAATVPFSKSVLVFSTRRTMTTKL
jgi:hypothetical protein